ncbi:YdbL family protein [Photobacterium toruni]|uniref:YdbL family protein n=1 Tax=Photobacterium toruni TaxID=1935446 RepID=A0A1T4R9B4_9GAMM|nr:YdbL family protein [Photobacterium toruni]MEC6830603.1 YdbL family protein [Photobacterium toruni]SKA12406.1 hypothetical protein CZ814_01232 [Photobacterium toruni]
MKAIILKKRLLSYGLLLCLFSPSALAITLQQAKQQGLVGEANNGLIAAIKPNNNTTINQLIISVNNHRQKTYQAISQSHSVSLNTIKLRAYHKAIEKTQSGHFYQDSRGSWKMKK